MRATITVALLLAFLTVGLAVWPLAIDRDRPDPEFLSTDLYFKLNDMVISVPAVAVLDVTVPPDNLNPLPERRNDRFFGSEREFATTAYKTALLELAAEPKDVSTIWINLGAYGTHGERLISQEICPKLTKDWSQKACDNQLRKELKSLPTNIRLSTEAGLEKFHFHGFSGVPDSTVFDLLTEMAPIQPEAKMACTAGREFCYAAMLVSKRLFAVWSTSCSNKIAEGCEHDLEQQGSEIMDFIDNELRIE